jgi:hypothetical protein
MIELRAVSVIFPTDQVALRDCSPAFDRGQFTVLLGPSGAVALPAPDGAGQPPGGPREAAAVALA